MISNQAQGLLPVKWGQRMRYLRPLLGSDRPTISKVSPADVLIHISPPPCPLKVHKCVFCCAQISLEKEREREWSTHICRKMWHVSRLEPDRRSTFYKSNCETIPILSCE